MRTSLLLIVFASSTLVGAGQGAAASAPVNGRIVFVTGDGLASMNPDGSGQWGLRFTRIGQKHPSWSPDGRTLVVADGTVQGAGQQLYTLQPDGTGVVQLTHVAAAYDPAWSPDGSRIAFTDGAGAIYTVKPDGSAVTQITTGESPAWSPDGRTLAFTRYAPVGGTSLLTIDLASGAVKQVTTTGIVNVYDPAWAPAGDRIAFAAWSGNGQALYTVAPSGGTPQRLTDGSWDTDPAWSPDGTQLAFVRNQQIWVVQRDGTGAHALTGSAFAPESPAWQPLPSLAPGCTISGTDGNDLLVGTPGNDVICGLGGDDTLIGLGGNDRLVGGDGNDWLAGGPGEDFLTSGTGDDRVDARDGDYDVIVNDGGYDLALVDPQHRDSTYGVQRVTVSRNVSAWRPTTTSSEEATNPGVLAVDGRLDDYWSSGAYPTQWIEIDLQRPTTIARVRLITPDLPSGLQVLLLGKGDAPGATYRLLHLVNGPDAFMQSVTVKPKRPWRKVRYVKLVIPSGPSASFWVSWPEIEVYST